MTLGTDKVLAVNLMSFLSGLHLSHVLPSSGSIV